MNDSNKESAKELLATMRAIFAVNVAGVIALINLDARDSLVYASRFWFVCGVGAALASLSVMIFCFFLCIPKLYRAEEGIVYQSDVAVSSLVGIGLFLVSCAIFVLNAFLAEAHVGPCPPLM